MVSKAYPVLKSFGPYFGFGRYGCGVGIGLYLQDWLQDCLQDPNPQVLGVFGWFWQAVSLNMASADVAAKAHRFEVGAPHLNPYPLLPRSGGVRSRGPGLV